MRHREIADVQDIKETEIVKAASIGEKEIRFRIQRAYVGTVGEKTELLDEILIDNMLEQMTRAVKNNYSKYNPLPDEIIIKNAVGKKQEEEQSTENKLSEKMIESYEPRYSLEQVALSEKVKEQIRTAIAAVRYKRKGNVRVFCRKSHHYTEFLWKSGYR